MPLAAVAGEEGGRAEGDQGAEEVAEQLAALTLLTLKDGGAEEGVQRETEGGGNKEGQEREKEGGT
jgi:hypothetical protein